MIALVLALALTPEMEQQIRETLPPGTPRIEEVATSGGLVLFCLATKGRA